MKNVESINDYFARTLIIANKMRMYGETMSKLNVIEKSFVQCMVKLCSVLH